MPDQVRHDTEEKVLEPILDKALYERFVEFERTGSRAVRAAQEESRRLGVPNVYEINGILHYERPDGSLTTEDPYEEWQRHVGKR